MQKEIKKAVETFHKIALGTANKSGKISEQKLAAFISALTELLTARYEKNWYPENPNRGSAYRCIRVNGQSIDPTVMESLKKAQIKYSKDLIITEVTIWVDPGVVSVRIGEDGSIGSEVVDENVYNIGREFLQKPESDEEFSSRSSSPGTSSLSGSDSARSSTNSSPVPLRHSSSPYVPTTEFNPYSPVYSNRYHFSSSSIRQPQRNTSPTANHLVPAILGSVHRSGNFFDSPVMSSHSRDLFNQSGIIPVSEAHQIAAASRSQSLFSSQENTTSGRSIDGIGKLAYNPYYAMSMMYGGNLQQTNFYDIPAMA